MWNVRMVSCVRRSPIDGDVVAMNRNRRAIAG
jgi:hypothetical protein